MYCMQQLRGAASQTGANYPQGSFLSGGHTLAVLGLIPESASCAFKLTLDIERAAITIVDRDASVANTCDEPIGSLEQLAIVSYTLDRLVVRHCVTERV